MVDNQGRMTPLEKMIRSSHYGLTDEQVAESMVGTGKTFDVNSRYPAELIEGTDGEAFDMHAKTDGPITHAAVIRVTPPDYADIQRLENLVWKSGTTPTDYHTYAHEYHQLAAKFTEDVLIYCIEQYNRGSRW